MLEILLPRLVATLIAVGVCVALWGIVDRRQEIAARLTFGAALVVLGLVLGQLHGVFDPTLYGRRSLGYLVGVEGVALMLLLFGPPLALFGLACAVGRRALTAGVGVAATAIGLRLGDGSGLFEADGGLPLLRAMLAIAYIYALPAGMLTELLSRRNPRVVSLAAAAGAAGVALAAIWATGLADATVPFAPGVRAIFSPPFAGAALAAVGSGALAATALPRLRGRRDLALAAGAALLIGGAVLFMEGRAHPAGDVDYGAVTAFSLAVFAGLVTVFGGLFGGARRWVWVRSGLCGGVLAAVGAALMRASA